MLVGCGGNEPAKAPAQAKAVASGETPSAKELASPTKASETPTKASETPTKAAESKPAPPLPLTVLGGVEIAGQGANPVVLEWEETMTNFSVSAVHLVIREDRHAHFERLGEHADTRDYVVPEADWKRVLEQLRTHKACTLRGSGEFEHEDQAPSLVIAVRGAACKVILSDVEWAMGPRAREVARAVATLYPSHP
ncbi:MAG: hypothetical protein ACPG4T_17605 [Nannocystaceae bacterium]